MLWLKAFHIVFMVTWFAGLFYLPRLFVYHADAQDEPSLERFVVMERRLYFITTIGAIGTVAFGLVLLGGWWWPAPLWLQVKLGLVALLILYQMFCYKLLRDFRARRNRLRSRVLRFVNEIPALFLIAIVLLVVLKPF